MLDHLQHLINYCFNNSAALLALFGSVVAVASIIVKLTPTQKDDAVLAKVLAVLDYVSIVEAKKTK